MLQEILTRGIERIYPSADRLQSGEKLTFYFGIDPTGPTLHMGHLIPILKLAQLQKLGHKVIFLIGDFTATIGDPTGKDSARTPLTHEQVLSNSRLYKKQASKFISFSGENKAEIKFNSKWLKKMNFADVLELASKMTVDQMLKRDMFEKRMAENKPISIHEFMYPLMQGYDSVAMDVDGEVGGNDQTFNMLVGRDLLRTLKNKDKVVIATKLLTDANGKKMGKTEGNMVSLDQTPEDMFGKVMSWTDDMMPLGYELLTAYDMPAGHPRDAKINLAKEIVALCHNKKAAERAHKNFEKTFSQKETPKDIQTIEVKKDTPLVDILLQHNLVQSKGEFRRLVEGNGVEIMGKEKLNDIHFKITENTDVKVGKRRFLRIILQNDL